MRAPIRIGSITFARVSPCHRRVYMGHATRVVVARRRRTDASIHSSFPHGKEDEYISSSRYLRPCLAEQHSRAAHSVSQLGARRDGRPRRVLHVPVCRCARVVMHKKEKKKRNHVHVHILAHSRIRKSGVESAQEKVGRETRARIKKKKKLAAKYLYLRITLIDARARTHARTYYSSCVATCCTYVRKEYGACVPDDDGERARDGREERKRGLDARGNESGEREKDNTCTRACALHGILSSDVDRRGRVAWNERAPSFSIFFQRAPSSPLLFSSYHLLAPSVSRRVRCCTLRSRDFVILPRIRLHLAPFIVLNRGRSIRWTFKQEDVRFERLVEYRKENR